MIFFALALLFLCTDIYAADPPMLPGKEISDEEYFQFIISPDTIINQVPSSSPYAPTWLDHCERSWDAVPLSVQIAQDNQKSLMGLGSLFIPYMSSDADLEPDIEIVNDSGKEIASGKTGRKYNVLPGKYFVILGSGSSKQRIVKQIQASDGVVSPIIPDWSGLSIDVVDVKNQPLRGEYELVRIDSFDPYGRGYGRNSNLGEKLKTWILKPGTYKIFSLGDGYNAVSNYITVRLLPGEFTRVVLVQKDLKIVGGGLIQKQLASQSNSFWRYENSIGGGIDFNYVRDNITDSATLNRSDISLQLNSLANYTYNPFELDFRLKIDQGVTFSNFSYSNMVSSVDEIKFSNLFIWHFLSSVGYYGRAEISTGIIPQSINRSDGIATSKYFVLLDNKKTLLSIDSTSNSFRIQPGLSPVVLEAGTGANVNLLSKRSIDMQLLTGIGISYETVRNEWRLGSLADVDTLAIQDIQLSTTDKVFIKKEKSRFDIGPEILLNLSARLGPITTIESEIKYLSPFKRITIPDLQWGTIISVRLLSSVTLDYEVVYSLIQTSEQDLRKNEFKNRVLIRFSYSRL